MVCSQYSYVEFLTPKVMVQSWGPWGMVGPMFRALMNDIRILMKEALDICLRTLHLCTLYTECFRLNGFLQINFRISSSDYKIFTMSLLMNFLWRAYWILFNLATFLFLYYPYKSYFILFFLFLSLYLTLYLLKHVYILEYFFCYIFQWIIIEA